MATEKTKIAPHSTELEQSLLGGLLINNEAFDEVGDILASEDFHEPRHQSIFRAIGELVENGEAADVVTVKERLKKNGQESRSGGFAYLAKIANETPSVANIRAYAKHLRELSLRRALIRESAEIANLAYNPKNAETRELLDEAERKIFAISERMVRQNSSVVKVKDMISEVVDLAQTMEKNPGLTGLETGFGKLDDLTSGLQKGDLIVVAGRPSMGKTAFAMNIVEHVAIYGKKDSNTPVLVFSLEMPMVQIVMRMIAAFGHINIKNIRDGKLSADDWNSFNQAVAALAAGNIYIDETAATTPTEIRAVSRRMKRTHPDLALIMVDYLQLMRVHGDRENRVQEISEISRSLKALAKELNVPVIALSQLNRAVESRPRQNKGRIPQMADLRESGSIEQDADVIVFIYRDEQYHDDGYQNPDEIGKADIKIAKHRNGATGMFALNFRGECTRFDNLADDSAFEDVKENETDASFAHNKDNFDAPF